MSSVRVLQTTNFTTDISQLEKIGNALCGYVKVEYFVLYLLRYGRLFFVWQSIRRFIVTYCVLLLQKMQRTQVVPKLTFGLTISITPMCTCGDCKGEKIHSDNIHSRSAFDQVTFLCDFTDI